MARPPNPDAPRRLLAAARAAFAASGVEQARVQDITGAAGFSKAAFYLYFESKDAVFAQLVHEFFRACISISDERHAAIQVLVAEDGPPLADDWLRGTSRLQRYQAIELDSGTRILATLWEWRDVFACIEQASGPRRAVIDQVMAATRDLTGSRLREAAAVGMLRPDIDVDLVAEMLVGIYLQLARRMLRLDAAPDFGAWARQTDRLVGSGVHPLPPATAPLPGDP